MKKRNFYRNFRLVMVSLVIMILFSSCNVLYIPSSHNSPMLSNKNEFQVSALVGTGINLQTAYAVTDHVGIMLNGYFYSSEKELKIEGNSTKKMKELWVSYEFGAGYYTKVFDVFTFEIFAGGGTGQVPADFRYVDYNYDGTQTSTMSTLFIQPALGFRSKLIDLSGVSRFSAIAMNNQMRYFFEPGLVAKLGYKNLRLMGNFGISIHMNNLEDATWDYLPFNVGLGLQYNIGRKY